MIQASFPDLDRAIQRIREHTTDIERRRMELCRRLAQYGLVLAEASFAGAAYDGPKDVSVEVEETENGYKIVASGTTVLLVEFGAGVTLGYGHPLASQFGYGPGTYPGQRHAMSGNGWYLPKSKGGGHTYGNPPSMTMYNTARDIRREIESIAREVFSS